MNFLTGPAALIAASIALPLLLLLYFLKLRRTERRVASTLLWKKAVQDLQVNAPFQKLRKNLLLLLQFLLLAAVLFAIAGPVSNFVGQPERNVVVLLDQSASMKTIESDGKSRIEHARKAAIDFIDNLAPGSKAMVISFSNRAEVVCTFTNDKRRLTDRIESVEANDGHSQIGEALQLAVAYSSSFVENPGDPGFVPDTVQVADIELFSDGRLTDADEEFVTRAKMMHHRVGDVADNVGITAFDVRREIDRPGVVSVFAQVQNFGPEPVRLDASLYLDDRLLSVQSASLGPSREATSRPVAEDVPDSGRNVVFEFEHDAGGILKIKLSREDGLMIDNVVTAPIDPPRAIRILAVTDEPELQFLIERAFRDALQISDVTMMTASQYESADDSEIGIEGRSAFDLVVFAAHSTDRLLPGNYLFFGGVPKVEGVSLGEDLDEQYFVTWREGHPLLRYVALDNVFTLKWKKLILPEHAAPLVDGEDSTVFALLTDPGHRYVIVAFDLLDSTFRMQPAFPIFMQNAVDYLSGGSVTEAGRLIVPGETISVQTAPGAQTMTVKRPDGTEDEIEIGGKHTVTYGKTRDVGAYVATFDDELKTTETYCANVLDPTESFIRPNDSLTLSGERVESIAGEVEVNEPLWPYAVGLAILLLFIEWWIYNRRVMI